MASWLTPLRPCCVNMQEDLLFPLAKILFGKDDNLFRDPTWSEDVLLALFWPQNPISRQDGEAASPSLLLLQALRLLVETQHPICSVPEGGRLQMEIMPISFNPFFSTIDLTWNSDLSSIVNWVNNPDSEDSIEVSDNLHTLLLKTGTRRTSQMHNLPEGIWIDNKTSWAEKDTWIY